MIYDAEHFYQLLTEESSFFRLKQLYGRSINCLKANTMGTETFIQLILYNLEEIPSPNLGHGCSLEKVYKEKITIKKKG